MFGGSIVKSILGVLTAFGNVFSTLFNWMREGRLIKAGEDKQARANLEIQN